MVGNATNWTFVDQMREPSGGGLIKASVQPYLNAFGEFSWMFYFIIVAFSMVMVYQRTNDTYAPLFVLMLAGAVMGPLLGTQGQNIGTLLIVLSLALMIFNAVWRRE